MGQLGSVFDLGESLAPVCVNENGVSQFMSTSQFPAPRPPRVEALGLLRETFPGSLYIVQ